MRLLSLALELREVATRPVQPSILSEVGRSQAGDGALGRDSQPGTPRKRGRDRSKRGFRRPPSQSIPPVEAPVPCRQSGPTGILPSRARARISAGMHQPAMLRARSAPSCHASHHRGRSWFAMPIRLAWNDLGQLPASPLRQLGQGAPASAE